MVDNDENETSAGRHILAPRSPQVPLVAGERSTVDAPTVPRGFPEKVSDRLVASLTRAEVAAIQHGKRQAQARGGGVGYLVDATFYPTPEPKPADKPVLEADKPPQPPRMFVSDVVMPDGVGVLGPMVVRRFKQWWAHDVNTNSPGTMQQPTLEIFQAWRAEDVKAGTRETAERNPYAQMIEVDNAPARQPAETGPGAPLSPPQARSFASLARHGE